MRILFVNAYFPPEIIAFTHLEKDLIEGLVSAGNEVEVVCPTPTRGVCDKTYREYKSIKSESLYDGSVRVKRFWAPREGKNPLIRAFRYLWCNIREYQIGRRYKNIDAVFAVSTPPTQGLLAGRLAKKLKCKFVYSLQDIFPDSLVTTGLASNRSPVYKIGRIIENKTYKYADKIIVISASCKNNLLNKGISEEKIELISNWVDIAKVKPIEKENNGLFDEFGIDRSKFIVLYAGNFGAAQGADIVLKAAENLRQEGNIQFVIFGGGAEYDAAVDYTEKNKIDNVIINPLLPAERISEVYSLGDVALITCKKGVGNSGMPSKTWSIMACNTPIIASFDTVSDMADILNQSGAGVCTPAGDADALSNAILEFKEGRGWVKTDLRAYVKNNAEKSTCVGRYIEMFYRCE